MTKYINYLFVMQLMYFSFCYVLTYSIIYIIFQNIYIKIQISESKPYDKEIYIYIQLSEKYFIEKITSKVKNP